MYCPSYIIISNNVIHLTMHSDRDVPKQYVPKTQWLNIFRYEFRFYSKVINKDGRAHIVLSNFFYTIKNKLNIKGK